MGLKMLLNAYSLNSRYPFRDEGGVKWSLVIRLHTGERSRIGLGSWLGFGIADARGCPQADCRYRRRCHS